MTDYEQFDLLFWSSARQVHSGPQTDSSDVPQAELWRAAQIGFTEEFGRETLTHHSWLVFLNRLWDSHRTQGLPDSPIRVPDKIWELADQKDDQGQLHRDLLEATGLTLPEDFGQELAFHLTLWTQETLVGVLRGSATTDIPTMACADGPVAITVSATQQGIHVEVRPDLAGRYGLTLHFADGPAETHLTPSLDSGQTYEFDLATTRDDLPQSVHVSRRK